jgi:hypothetical protein
MSLFFFNWCVFSTLQVTLLIRHQVFVRNAANALNPGANFISRLVVSEVRLTTLTALAEPEAFAIRNSDWLDQAADMAGSASIFCTISGGVLAGAKIPCHESTL